MPEPELPSSSARRTAIAVITFWTALNTLGAVRKWMVKPPGPERLLTAGLHAPENAVGGVSSEDGH